MLVNSLMTDTGSGSKTPVPSSSASQKVATTSATSRVSTPKKKVATSVANNTNTNTVKQPTFNGEPSYSWEDSSGGGGGGGGSSSGGGGGSEEVTYNSKPVTSLYNTIIKLMEKEFSGAKNSANSYLTGATNNLNSAQGTWQDVYNQNAANLADLKNQNAQRESYINDLLSQYYNTMSSENAKRENATMGAIDQAYRELMGNAAEYYQNLLGTYDRSMGYVNQGYEEGRQLSQSAKDEAVRLAQELYDMEAASQNRQTEKDLRGQYISYMNGMKNLGQRLSAAGINGGATETSFLNALNGYEQSRTALNEARANAMGQLRQTQMQSDSAALQTYLNALRELTSQRTANQLGVENTRASQEQAYAGMLNEAAANRGNQLITAQNNFQNWANDLQSNYANMSSNAQNNFQNWASNLVNQTSSNNDAYANAIAQLANDKNNVLANYQQIYNNALSNRTSTMLGTQGMASELAQNGIGYNVSANTSNKTNSEINKSASNVISGKKSYSSASSGVKKAAVTSAINQINSGKLKLSDIKDKDLKKAIKADSRYKSQKSVESGMF
jgi:hypothetical protein